MIKVSRTKLLSRQHDRRDARLFIVATEGAITERQYFQIFNNTRIKVEVLATGEDHKSALQHVLERLNEFKEKYDLDDEDMLWLVLDVDSWGSRNLSSVCRQAKQKGYQLAISNPCFEVWLCLHFGDLNPEDSKSRDFKVRLRTILGSYNSSNLDLSLYKPYIKDAIVRAKQLHPNTRQNWPPTFGTHVYRLVDILYRVLELSS